MLVHNPSAPTNPNLRIVQASPSLFRAEDSTNSQFFIMGALTQGVLTFTVVARLSTGQTGMVSGREFFDALMTHFQPSVIAIEAHWIMGIDLDTNIEQFNYWTGPGGGLADSDAARKTWTGRRAADYQFNNVAILFKNPQNSPGKYIEVAARFTK